MEKMIISRTIDSAGFFELTLTPRLTFLLSALKSGHHSQKTESWSLTILGKETTMNEILGDYAIRCCACNAKIEDIKDVKCYDFDDMIVKCRQCTNSPNKNPHINPHLFNTSVQRFLIGNVI